MYMYISTDSLGQFILLYSKVILYSRKEHNTELTILQLKKKKQGGNFKIKECISPRKLG